MEFRIPTKTESLVHFSVTDLDGSPVTDASVTMTITGPDGTVWVNGEAMAWDSGDQDYQYVIPADTFTPPSGAGYLTRVVVSVSGVQKLNKKYPTFIFDDNE